MQQKREAWQNEPQIPSAHIGPQWTVEPRHGKSESPWHRFRSKFIGGDPAVCWEWTGALDRNGYGLLARQGDFAGGAANISAHRVSWMFFHGEIRAGLHVLHKCDNRKCVNPEHLFLGTQQDNNRDMHEKGRYQRGQTHYRAGFTEDDIRAIRSSTKTRAELAREYNTQWPTIDKIVRRLRWKHVT